MSSHIVSFPNQSERFNFFHYLSTDINGKIGTRYIDFKNTLDYFLNITPEEFFAYYLQFKTYYEYQQSNPTVREDKKVNLYWLSKSEEDILRMIREIYKNLKESNTIYKNGVLVPDERPLIFRLALDLWLYIYH